MIYINSLYADEDSSSPSRDDQEIVTVEGQRLKKQSVDKMSKIEITAREAELVAPKGDIAQTPKLFPGTVSTSFAAEVSIRGSDRDNTLYMVDNIQLPDLFEPISGTSVVPNKAISSLSFYPGNFDTQYGNATGGVITLTTRGEEIIEPYSEFRMNMPIYLSAYHERNFDDDSTLIVSFRKSTLDSYLSLLPKDSLRGSVIVPYFQDAYLQHYTHVGEITVKSKFVHSRTGVNVKVFSDRSSKTDGSSEFNFKRGFDLLGVDIEMPFFDEYLQIDPYVDGFNILVGSDMFNFEIESKEITVPLRTRTVLSENLTVFYGAQLKYFDYKLYLRSPDLVGQDEFRDIENAPIVEVIKDSSESQLASWGTFEWQQQNWTLALGARLFKQSNIEKFGIDPRLVARYGLNGTNTLKLAIGSYSVAPKPEEVDDEYGNPKLTWIGSKHYSVGWEALVLHNWTSEVQLFHKNWHNDIYEDRVKRFTHDTTRKSSGFEWFFRYENPGPMFGWISYTYSQTKEKRGEAQEVSSDNDITHVLHLVGNYKFSDTLQIGSRIKFQSGSLYTPIDKVWYQADSDTYNPSNSPDLVNAERNPDTLTLSLFVQKDFKFKNWTLVSRMGFDDWQLQESNSNFSYNYDYSDKVYSKGLLLIPYLEVRAIL